MAELRQNTWSLNAWYEQDYAGDVSYSGTGAAYAWGRNNYGQLGLNQSNTSHKSSPVQIPGNWATIRAGSSNNFGVKSDGTLWAWGRNDQGQLGHNNKTHYSSPVQIPGTTWSKDRLKISNIGVFNSYAIKTDATLWSWGYGTNGRLGQNSNTNYSSPRQVPGTTWNIVSSSYNGQFAIKTDGTLWSWGWNNNGGYGGLLGHNNKTNYSSPRQVGSDTDWDFVTVSADSGSIFAHKTDGTLWSWGYNGSGQLGIGNKTAYSSPKQVPGSTWSGASAAIAGASSAGFAIRTDGTLWGWGAGQEGQLAQNNLTEYSSPRQIPGTTWSKVTSRGTSVFAMKTDGTAWAWGKNNYGQLGVNNETKYSSPVQIPGTAWDIIEGGNDHTIGRQIH
jgi:alpha-tubulin suppressor-like RCC1 family protein